MRRDRLFTRKLDLRKGTVELIHGAGGKASAQLFEELFLPAFENPILAAGDDAAAISAGERIIVSTDGHVVNPIFFPGGDIGSLAVHGTINDVAMGGGQPGYLTAGFILEDGFPLYDLAQIVESMGEAARKAGVQIVAGDTKVVERGKGDGIFITTTGIGTLHPRLKVALSAQSVKVGDQIILSGPIGEHGITILAAREGLPLSAPIKSDSTALHGMIGALLDNVPSVRVLRDPTRGGLATAINEICRASGTGALLYEKDIDVRRPVEAACEILGVDPLYLANEGKCIAIVAEEDAHRAVAAMRDYEIGAEAAIVSEITADPDGFVQMETTLGGRRMVDWLTGDPLPRIC